MTNILQQGADWLEDMRHRHATVEVTYVRDTESVSVQATIGRTIFEVENGRGVLEKFESRDFLVLTQDLVLDGSPVLPERGDTILETQGPTVHVYEVMAPGKEPHYRYSDPFRKTLRVHTKQVGTEAAP
ncbi:MAG: hypothetical protein AB7F75_00800 [Planctomycetota bacterium]